MSKPFRRLSFIAAITALTVFGILAVPVAAAGISVDPTYGNFDTTFSIHASGFQRNEIVDTWITVANGSTISTGTKRADDSGNVSWSFKPQTSYGGGEYIAVAHGRVTGEVFAKFNVVAPPSEKPAPNGDTEVKEQVLAPVSQYTVPFSGSGYLAGETVATWYQLPNGNAYAYKNFYADAWGNLAFDFTVGKNWMYGGYILVGRGLRSGNTAYVRFSYFGSVSDIRANKPITKPSPYYDFNQSGFRAGERVSLWIGLPNGTNQALGLVYANGSGVVNYRVNILPGWPAGGYIVVAYGWTSHVIKWQRFAYFGHVERLYP